MQLGGWFLSRCLPCRSERVTHCSTVLAIHPKHIDSTRSRNEVVARVNSEQWCWPCLLWSWGTVTASNQRWSSAGFVAWFRTPGRFICFLQKTQHLFWDLSHSSYQDSALFFCNVSEVSFGIQCIILSIFSWISGIKCICNFPYFRAFVRISCKIRETPQIRDVVIFRRCCMEFSEQKLFTSNLYPKRYLRNTAEK